jgi:hypothetical protein
MKLPITAVFLGLATSACSAPAPTTEGVIARTTEAMGGGEALRNLRNVRIAAEWKEGGRAFKGDYRATREGLMRIDVFIDGERVYSEGFDAQGAWEQAGEGAAVQSVGAAARDALTHGVSYRFNGIWFARERGQAVEYLGTETVEKIPYHVMRLKFPDGFETYFYINPKTWLPERQRDERAYHPSSDPKKITIESVQADFALRCGVAMALTSRDINLASTEVLAERRVSDAQCNVDAAALDLERPR